MKTVTFSIAGMHCNSCALSIECDIEEMPGVHTVKTSYPKAQAVVDFDENTLSEQQIIETIKKAGYTANKV